MKFLIDAQLPPALCRWLVSRGHDAVHVADVLPGEAPDAAVSKYSISNQLILISKDEDFVTRYPPGEYRLLWLRVGNATNRALSEWLETRWATIEALLEAGEVLVEVQ